MSFADFFSKGFLGYFWVWSSDTAITDTARLLTFGAGILISLLAAYFLGSLNFAIIISGKQYKQDIRSFGSKNAGMTNMMRTYGKKAAGITLLGDALKAVVAALIGYAMLGYLGAYIAGLFCIIGHMFPIYYHFRGGKGVVTAAVSILMCNPIAFLILFVIFALLVLATRYISVGSVMCMLLYPIVLDRIYKIMYGVTCPYLIYAVLMTVLVVVKHHENISRLIQGKESKFSFKKSVKKADVGETVAETAGTSNVENTETDDRETSVPNAKKSSSKKTKHYGKKKR